MISSKILKLSSLLVIKMLNWTISHMSADFSKATEKKENAWTRFFLAQRHHDIAPKCVV